MPAIKALKYRLWGRNYLKNSFSYTGAVLWNSLPAGLRQAKTLESFKAGLR